jgi:uncharacterized protein
VRVVFDTNILVSALVFPGKQAEKATLRVIDGRDHLLLSKEIVDELLGVLAGKFARDAEELARAAIFLADLGEMVRPKRRLHGFKDEADNRIIECAIAGQAAAIVTGDREMLRQQIFENVAIISLRAYLDR